MHRIHDTAINRPFKDTEPRHCFRMIADSENQSPCRKKFGYGKREAVRNIGLAKTEGGDVNRLRGRMYGFRVANSPGGAIKQEG